MAFSTVALSGKLGSCLKSKRSILSYENSPWRTFTQQLEFKSITNKPSLWKNQEDKSHGVVFHVNMRTMMFLQFLAVCSKLISFIPYKRYFFCPLTCIWEFRWYLLPQMASALLNWVYSCLYDWPPPTPNQQSFRRYHVSQPLTILPTGICFSVLNWEFNQSITEF